MAMRQRSTVDQLAPSYTVAKKLVIARNHLPEAPSRNRNGMEEKLCQEEVRINTRTNKSGWQSISKKDMRTKASAMMKPKNEPGRRLTNRHFDASSRELVVLGLSYLVPSAFFYVSRDLLTRVFYAHKDTQTPLYLPSGSSGSHTSPCSGDTGRQDPRFPRGKESFRDWHRAA